MTNNFIARVADQLKTVVREQDSLSRREQILILCAARTEKQMSRDILFSSRNAVTRRLSRVNQEILALSRVLRQAENRASGEVKI